jgi:hypothetical protein
VLDLPPLAHTLGEIPMKNKWIHFVVLALALTLTLRPSQAADAFVRVLHGVSLGTKVDVHIDGNKKYNDVEFGKLTKYIRIPAGVRAIRVTTNNPSRTIISSTRSFRRGEFFTLGLYGLPNNLRLENASDSSGEPRYGQARITAYNFSPNQPAFDVVAYMRGGRIVPLIRNVGYGKGKAGNIPAQALTVRLVRNGRILKTITGVSPKAGRKYALYAVGRPSRNFTVLLGPTATQ